MFNVCQFTFNDVNPHWSVDVVRYGAGVVTLVHGAGLPHNLNLHIQQHTKIDQEILFVDEGCTALSTVSYRSIYIQGNIHPKL